MGNIDSQIPATLSTKPEEIADLPGYMGAQTQTKLPHVFNGDLWFPNVFLARLYFLEVHRNVLSCEMEWLARLHETTISGVMFFRFSKVGL